MQRCVLQVARIWHHLQHIIVPMNVYQVNGECIMRTKNGLTDFGAPPQCCTAASLWLHCDLMAASLRPHLQPRGDLMAASPRPHCGLIVASLRLHGGLMATSLRLHCGLHEAYMRTSLQPHGGASLRPHCGLIASSWRPHCGSTAVSWRPYGELMAASPWLQYDLMAASPRTHCGLIAASLRSEAWDGESMGGLVSELHSFYDKCPSRGRNRTKILKV